MWVTPVPTTTYIPSFMKIGRCILAKVYLFVDEKPTSSIIHHTYRQRDNENLSGPSSITGGPQKRDEKWRRL